MLFDGPRRDRALAYVEQALKELEAPARDSSKLAGVAAAGVARGAVGSAVAIATAAKVLERPALDGLVEALLGQAQDLATTHAVGPSMFTGLAGICWGYDYVASLNDDDGDEIDDEAFEGDEIEDDEESDDDPNHLLLSLLDESPDELHYDLMSGAIGIANYALLVRERASGERLLSRTLDVLQERLCAHSGGRLWFSRPEHVGPSMRERYPGGLHDLGYAHGSSGGLACLSAALHLGVRVDALRGPVREICTALRSNEQTEYPEWGRYADILGGAPARRVAWCYGDLGMSFAFAGAGRALGDASVSAYGEWLAEEQTRRVGETTGIRDAALCHGAAGAAHLFHRWYLATGRDVFAAAALRWFDAIFALPTRWDVALQRADNSNLEYLEGKAGIALALLSALSDTHHPWDYPLGLHLPASRLPCARKPGA